MKPPTFNAAEAFELAQERSIDKATEQLSKVLVYIRRDAECGHFTSSYPAFIMGAVKSLLEAAGYNVQCYSDQRDGAYTTISWANKGLKG